jgi:hypothetical protein
MIYIISNERLENEVANLYKIEDERSWWPRARTACSPEQEHRWTHTHKQRPIIEPVSRAGRPCGTVYIVGTFSQAWWSLPGLKGQHLVPVGATTQNKRPSGPLVPVGGSNKDWKSTFSPGWRHRPGLNVPSGKPAALAVGQEILVPVGGSNWD